MFDLLKIQNPNIFSKLQVIDGDCSKIGLGLRPRDLERLKSVSIIFHSAASVRFDEPLKQSILLNTRGTSELCKLAEKLPNLKAFVHVSTAFCNAEQSVVEEKVCQVKRLVGRGYKLTYFRSTLLPQISGIILILPRTMVMMCWMLLKKSMDFEYSENKEFAFL